MNWIFAITFHKMSPASLLAQVSEVDQADFLVTHIMDKWVSSGLVVEVNDYHDLNRVVVMPSCNNFGSCPSSPHFAFSEQRIWVWRTKWGCWAFSVKVYVEERKVKRSCESQMLGLIWGFVQAAESLLWHGGCAPDLTCSSKLRKGLCQQVKHSIY